MSSVSFAGASTATVSFVDKHAVQFSYRLLNINGLKSFSMVGTVDTNLKLSITGQISWPGSTFIPPTLRRYRFSLMTYFGVSFGWWWTNGVRMALDTINRDMSSLLGGNFLLTFIIWQPCFIVTLILYPHRR
jgi:hypothetical protein